MGLPDVFGAAAANNDPCEIKPINERDVIPIRRNDVTNLNVVSSSYIARTGNIPAFVNSDGQNYHINWQPPDSFTKAVHTAAEATVKDLQADRDVQKLLQKPSWTKEDREQWEQKEAMYAAQERSKVGLGDYRTIAGVPELKDRKDIQQDAINITNLNDLSKDLDGHTKKYRNDCGIMSAVDAVVLDRAEQLLPKSAGAGDYKRASAYYYTNGGVSGQDFGLNDKIGGHSFLISSATGNVIEATATAPGSHAYNKATNGNSLEQYVKGRPIITQDGTVYGAWSNIADHNFARVVAGVEKTAAHDDGKIFNRAELMARDKTPGTAVTEAPGNGLLMVTSKGTEKGQDKYEVKVFERQNVGTPQEGYVLVGYNAKQQAAGAPPPKMSVDFEEKDGQFKGKYRFEAAFDNKGVKADIEKATTKSKYFGLSSETTYSPVAERQADYAKGAPPPKSVPVPVPAPAPAPAPVKSEPVKTEPAKTPPPGSAPAKAAPAQPDPADVKAIQTELKGRGMYSGQPDGKWSPELNHALNKYLWEQQTAGKDAGTYKLNVDQIYGGETKKSMEAAMKAKDPLAPSPAMFKALNDMRDSGALRTVYRKEDLHVPGPVTVTADAPKVAPVSAPAGGRITPPGTRSPAETYEPPAPPRTLPAGGGYGQLPARGAAPQTQPQAGLPPGAVDLTGLRRADKYGATFVTLSDDQGRQVRASLDPQALSGVVQVGRDPRNPNNVLLSVSDRDGQNRASYSMSAIDAGRVVSGYGAPANPLFQQIRGINVQILSEQIAARENRRNAGYGAPDYGQQTAPPNWRPADAYSSQPPARPYGAFPTAPQMGVAFGMESRGVGPYGAMMAQREAMIMARREQIIMNAGGFEPRGVSVNIGVRFGR